MTIRGRGRHFTQHWSRGASMAAARLAAPGRTALEMGGLRRGALPDYLVIGAMKAGSTTLYDRLVTHPLTAPAVEKEVHFFDFHFRRGTVWYRSQLPTTAQLDALGKRYRRDVDPEYRRPGLAGEASPTYLFHPLAPRRAAVTVPHAKLVVILRDPVSRAYSHYQTGIRHDWEALSFEEALAVEPARLEGQIDALLIDEAHHRSFPRYRWSYQAMGHYAEMLGRWLEYFSRDQLHVLFTEQLAVEPQKVYDELWSFLGLPSHRVPSAPIRARGTYRPMDPSTRERLRDYFAPHDARLAALLGTRLPWR